LNTTNPMRRPWQVGALVATVLLGACAKNPIPYKQPIDVTPPSGEIAVSQAVTIFDASGSHAELFPDGKATFESVVASMPDGTYEAAQIQFGGADRASTGLAGFDRGSLATAARNAAFLEGSSPLYSIFEEDLVEVIRDGSGRAAVVVISDGLATDYAGRGGVQERTLLAAREVMEARGGEVCFHTVQSGTVDEGGAFLRELSEVTDCGSFRTASSLGSAAALEEFSRTVYLSDGSMMQETVVALEIPDTDGDGIVDPDDACPNTLRRARVDGRGCWTLRGLRFAVNGAAIESGFEAGLREDVDVLQANEDVRIRIDGYTDSDGAAAYNQSLSERRAQSVRDYLVAAGVSGDRLTIKGFGESNPIAPNDSASNKRLNRRVELTIVD